MKVITHTERCIASGACVLASPEVFGQDEDGFVVLLDEAPADSEHESVRDAARSCPATVIELE
jgi:ferredoxin